MAVVSEPAALIYEPLTSEGIHENVGISKSVHFCKTNPRFGVNGFLYDAGDISTRTFHVLFYSLTRELHTPQNIHGEGITSINLWRVSSKAFGIGRLAKKRKSQGRQNIYISVGMFLINTS